MPAKFTGTFDELKYTTSIMGMPGDWQSDGTGKHTYRAASGGIVNWWESKKTLQFQGPQEAKVALEQAFDSALSSSPTGAAPLVAQRSPGKKQQIFIVHGHDLTARDQLELMLHRLGLEPFILMNSSGAGKTLIEALEGHIGRDFSTDFGIVLMTPDDIGYSKTNGPDKGEPRARQNVILETGMLLSSLTRSRMALVVKGHLEIPSDLEGIIRFGYNDHIREIVPKLCQRLKEAGFSIDTDAISAASC